MTCYAICSPVEIHVTSYIISSPISISSSGACFVILDNAFYVANKVIKILLIATGRPINCSDNDRFKILEKKSKKLEQKIVQNVPSQATSKEKN